MSALSEQRPASRGAWQQPVMTLGVLLIVAGALLPVAGGLMRLKLSGEMDNAAAEFGKAVTAASDAHGTLVAAMTGNEPRPIIEAITYRAERDPRRAFQGYAKIEADYANWVAAGGRTELHPDPEAAKQGYDRALQWDTKALELGAQHEAVLGRFVRYAGFVGSTGVVLLLWALLAGLSRPKRSQAWPRRR